MYPKINAFVIVLGQDGKLIEKHSYMIHSWFLLSPISCLRRKGTPYFGGINVGTSRGTHKHFRYSAVSNRVARTTKNSRRPIKKIRAPGNENAKQRRDMQLAIRAEMHVRNLITIPRLAGMAFFITKQAIRKNALSENSIETCSSSRIEDKILLFLETRKTGDQFSFRA